MSGHPRYPYLQAEWTVCSVCGFSYPVYQVRRHPRGGWQCLPGNLWGTSGCWNGLMRDELRVYPRPYEGVRRSPAPTVDETVGKEAGDTVPFVLLHDRAVPSATYKLKFTTELSFEAVTQPPRGGEWLRVPGGSIWFQNGEMHFDIVSFGGEPDARLPAGVDMQIVGGELHYLAPLA